MRGIFLSVAEHGIIGRGRDSTTLLDVVVSGRT